MKRFPMLASLLLLLLAVAACSKHSDTDTNCHSLSDVYGYSITGPDTVASGAYAGYAINFNLPNNCSKLLGIKVANPDSVTQRLTLQVQNNGCDCSTFGTGRSTQFDFRLSRPGLYYLQLAQPPLTDVIVKKIVVR